MDAQPFLVGVAVINRLCEYIKPKIRALNISVEWQDAILMLFAALAGAGYALATNLNILAAYAVNPVFAQILTGIVISLGADVVNVLLDYLYAGRDVIRARAFVNYQRGDLVLLPHADTEAERKSA